MILRRNSIKKTRKSRVFRVEFRVSKLEKSSFSSRVSSRVYSKSRVFRVGFRVWVLKTRTWLETRLFSSSIVWLYLLFMGNTIIEIVLPIKSKLKSRFPLGAPFSDSCFYSSNSLIELTKTWISLKLEKQTDFRKKIKIRHWICNRIVYKMSILR